MMDNNRFPRIAPDESGIQTFYVDGKPFWMLAGELHNSSASDAAYMEREVWPYLRGMNINTVLLTVAWEDIEPEEGKFDFHLMDAILEQARREQVRLVLLWFGLWKNGESYYAPPWVKQDTARFFRSRFPDGTPSETISPFCKEGVEADKKAFCELMTYLKEHDAENTVIMVQVENEVGILRADRDYSDAANAVFEQAVDPDVADLYGVQGTWQEAFGELGGMKMMACQYAKDLQEIAAAGKAIWPLPMYVNAWQDQHPCRPGCYPSGGPIAPTVDLWQRVAPAIDFCSPDIYVPYFVEVCERYMVGDNTIFVPETYRNAQTAANALYLFGGMNGIGISPFGIEDMQKQAAPDGGVAEWQYLAESYALLDNTRDYLLKAREEGRVHGFVRRNKEWGTLIPLEKFDVQLDFLDNQPGTPASAGIVIEEENGIFLMGCNVRYKLLPKVGSRDIVALGRMEEGQFVKGEWKRGRILNGDELFWDILGNSPVCRYVGVTIHR